MWKQDGRLNAYSLRRGPSVVVSFSKQGGAETVQSAHPNTSAHTHRARCGPRNPMRGPTASMKCSSYSVVERQTPQNSRWVQREYQRQAGRVQCGWTYPASQLPEARSWGGQLRDDTPHDRGCLMLRTGGLAQRVWYGEHFAAGSE